MPKIELNKSTTGSAFIINSGKTFAVRVKVDCILWFSSKHLQELPPPGKIEFHSLALIIPNIRMESKAIPLTPDGKPMEVNNADIAALTDGGWYTYIYGTVAYYDIFNRFHHTDFCWFRTGIEGEFTQCEMHNDAD